MGLLRMMVFIDGVGSHRLAIRVGSGMGRMLDQRHTAMQHWAGRIHVLHRCEPLERYPKGQQADQNRLR